jgi:hypothetical protein
MFASSFLYQFFVFFLGSTNFLEGEAIANFEVRQGRAMIIHSEDFKR